MRFCHFFHVVPYLYDILASVEHNRKYLVSYKTVLATIDFHCMDQKIPKNKFILYTLFCYLWSLIYHHSTEDATSFVQQKKESFRMILR